MTPPGPASETPGWLLSSAAAGDESVRAYLKVTPEGAADEELRVKLQSSGLAVHTIAGDVVTVTVPRGAWGSLLNMDIVVGVEPAGTVGKKK